MLVSNVSSFNLGHVDKICKESVAVIIGHLHQALQALRDFV